MNMNKEDWWQAMIVVIVILAAFNLAATLELSAKVKPVNEMLEQNSSFNCDTIPVKYLIEEPICAEKLLDAMNESAVRVDPRNVTSIDNEVKRQTQYWVEKYIQWHTKKE